MENIYIFGYKGQDGSLIQKKLGESKLDRKFYLFTKDSLKIVYKELVIQNFKILNELDYLDIVSKILIKNKPYLIFYFAAVHLSSTESEENIQKGKMLFTNYSLISYIFNQCLILGYKPKFIYASSSLVFSGSNTSPQNEETTRKPLCNYSRQKVLSEDLLIKLGVKYDIPVLVPIFYNHESFKRQEKFFTKKVISFFSKKSKNKELNIGNKITLYNPDSIIDMGYAEEYIDILLKLSFSDNTGSYIFSTGHSMTVKCFVNYVLDYYGLSDNSISYMSTIARNKTCLLGDNSKLAKAIGCIPSINGKKLAIKLCNDYENHINN